MAERKKGEIKNQDIVHLKGPDTVRLRPGVMFGSDGIEGCQHSVFEILSNSVDEAREGFGDVINITAWRDHSIEVEDFGRGVPLGFNEREQRYNWELVFCELYAGGKYANNSGDSAYEFSLGLNGLGACATQFASEYMTVKSYNGETLSEISFKKGFAVTDLQVTELSKKERRTGTVIRWKPDIEVFTDIDIPKSYYEEILKKQAIANPGLKFVFRWEQADGTFETSEYVYAGGIAEYAAELAAGDSLFPPIYWSGNAVGRDRGDKEDYKLKYEFAFTFTRTVSAIEYYHNSSFLEHGGSPDKAMRSAFLFSIDKYLRANDKYTKSEAKITVGDILDSLVFISNSFSTQTSYENQTKKAITNTFITESMTQFLKHQFEIFFAENPLDADKIATQVLINKRSRETAEDSRVNYKKKLQTSNDITNKVEKYVDCRSKDPKVKELYIVEGDSALSSVKLARDANFQAIIPVRGKTLNCLKASYDKIFESQIIVDLLKIIGCGVEIKTRRKGSDAPFDLNALKFSKIIICTDADEDGFQIRTLILTIFYRLLPTLIREGKVFIAETPLYEITTKNDTLFAYDETEKAEILAGLEGTKYTIQRSKGLGENQPDMMRKTTMDPSTRRLIRISPTDEQLTYEIFDTLLGDNLTARKAFIAEKAYLYIKDADI